MNTWNIYSAAGEYLGCHDGLRPQTALALFLSERGIDMHRSSEQLYEELGGEAWRITCADGVYIVRPSIPGTDVQASIERGVNR